MTIRSLYAFSVVLVLIGHQLKAEEIDSEQPHSSKVLYEFDNRPVNGFDGPVGDFGEGVDDFNSIQKKHRLDATIEEPKRSNEDESLELSKNDKLHQAEWDKWHLNLSTEIHKRFNCIASQVFDSGKVRQLHPNATYFRCRVAYTVYNNGTIATIGFIDKSPSPFFNGMVLMVIKSMNGNQILRFPDGSLRTSVEKTCIFQRTDPNRDSWILPPYDYDAQKLLR